MEKAQTIYVDMLSVFSVLAVVRAGFRKDKVLYFSRTRAGMALSRCLTGLGFLKSAPEEVDFRLSEVRDESGECSFFFIIEDISRICAVLIRDDLSVRPVIKGLGRYFPLRDLLHFFVKIIEQEIREKIIHIHVADWRQKKHGQGKEGFFLLERELWSKHVQKYMSTRTDLRISGYWSFNFLNWQHYLPRVWKKIKKTSPAPVRAKDSRPAKNSMTTGDRPRVAHWYTGKTITFEPGMRCDFFWFLESGMKKEDLLLCFDSSGLNREVMSALIENELAFSRWHAGAWPSGLLNRVSANVVKKAVWNWMTTGLRFDAFSLFYLFTMMFFARNYSRYHYFFKQWDIKVSVNQNDLGWQHVPMKLALADRGGITISYQWSNLRGESVPMSGCSDVMFTFGPYYNFFWKLTKAPVSWLLRSGYITDYSFPEVKTASRELRDSLKLRGAEFIICFFDENSSEDRNSLISNKASLEVHRYFLERVIEDSKLGLILKPGYPNTFYERMSGIEELLEKAVATGRCVVMDKGQGIKTDKYPSEAAQAADLAVCLLLSGTTALESHLSGVKTVFLDLENLQSDPVYTWGKGKAVFNGLDELFAAINGYRSGNAPVGFGDISRWAEGKDPFMDGHASLRIGRYVGWLFEKLKEGSGRTGAIEFANARYADSWGKGSVSKWH